MPQPQATLPATSVLFERYGAMVYRRCLQLLDKEHDALDATQEVFMRVIEKRETFRGEAAPSTWLYGAATLLCLQWMRNRDRRRVKLELLSRFPEASQASLDDRLAAIELLNGEPDELCLMVFLRYVDELTLDEVAEVVGRSRKTIALRLKELRQRARLNLEEGETT